MRRSEKEVTDPDIINLVLNEGEICRLGLIDQGRAYIVPMNFGYENNTLYFHSATGGKKIGLLKDNPEISFEIDIRHRIVEESAACGWSAFYLSVIGAGKVEFISTLSGKVEAMNLIMKKYSGKDNWEFNKQTLQRTALFKLCIEEISCKGSE